MTQERKTTAPRTTKTARGSGQSGPVDLEACAAPIDGPKRSRESFSVDPLYFARETAVTDDPRERKRSSLAGVWLTKQMLERSERRLEDDRKRYAEAIVAARDNDATVAEIAQQAGVSRNALYLFMNRVKKGKR